MYNFNKNYFCEQKSRNPQIVFNQMHYKKAASTVGIFTTSRLFTLSRLITNFHCGHNELKIARGD